MKTFTVSVGDSFIMPEPIEMLNDHWDHAGWQGKVISFKQGTAGEGILAAVKDADGVVFHIEVGRLTEKAD